MRIWGATDIGTTRKTNQDTYKFEFLNEDTQVAVVVCDGMGGANAGNVASSIAADVFLESIRSSAVKQISKEYAKALTERAVETANQKIYELSKENEEFSGMGTTLVALLLSGNRATIVNVGDSRCYHINNDGIRKVTKDHSLVAQLIESGRLTENQAKNHPNKNLITRALGAEHEVAADIFQPDVKKGDCLFLCTDGLSNYVSEQEILYEVVHGGEYGSCCERLIDIANARGGSDNITAALVEV